MVGDIIGRLVVSGLLIAFSGYVVRAWVRWFRAQVRLTPPRWRSGITTVGFGASTLSLAAIVAVGVHALFTGGLPYYHPVLMVTFGVGFLTASVGVFAALIGTGQLEVPTIISSVLCLLIWLVEAMAQ